MNGIPTPCCCALLSIGENLDTQKKEEELLVLPPESVSLRLLVTPSYANKALKKTEREIHQYITLEENTAVHIVETIDRVKLQDLDLDQTISSADTISK